MAEVSKDKHMAENSKDKHMAEIDEDKPMAEVSKDKPMAEVSNDKHTADTSEDKHMTEISEDNPMAELSKDKHRAVVSKNKQEIKGKSDSFEESEAIKSKNSAPKLITTKNDFKVSTLSVTSELVKGFGGNIWNDTFSEKRHSFDVTKLRTINADAGDGDKTHLRISASKSVEDVRNRCKHKETYSRRFGAASQDLSPHGPAKKGHSSELKCTLARVLGKTVPDHIRSFMDLFSKDEDAGSIGKDKKKSWRRSAQRRPRYKEQEKDISRYEPVTIYTKLRKNQWTLTVPSNSICYDDVELTEDQRKELRKAFLMFEKGGKNKMAARDLGELLRCLGWNPSERELEEARHELVVSARGSVSFSEIERYVARRGGICNGCKDEDDIHEAFQVLDQDGDGKISVNKFKHFMTTLGEKMSDREVDEILQSMKKDKDHSEYLEYKVERAFRNDQIFTLDDNIIEGLEDTDLDS